MKKAIFDLDGTVIEGSAGFLLAQQINQIGKFKNWDLFLESQKLVTDTHTAFDEAITKLTELFASGIKALPVRTMMKCVRLTKKKMKIRDHFRQLYKALNSEFRIYLITSSPLEATIPLSRKFRFERVYALQLEVVDGLYTGGHAGPMTLKRKKRIVEEEILPNSDFSFGVGDSYEDMLIYQETDLRFMLSESPFHGLPETNFIKVSNFRELNENILSVLRRH